MVVDKSIESLEEVTNYIFCFLIRILKRLNHDCTTFTSRENVLNENTVGTEGIQIILYLIMSSIYLVRQCCFY